MLESPEPCDVVERARPILARYRWQDAARQTLDAIIEAGAR
jgi:hypothetical protein